MRTDVRGMFLEVRISGDSEPNSLSGVRKYTKRERRGRFVL